MRGLAGFSLQRSVMTKDGTQVMESIGQIPGSWGELFWTERKQPVRTCGSRSGVAGKKFFFPESAFGGVDTESCDWSRKRSRDYEREVWMYVGKAAGVCDWVVLHHQVMAKTEHTPERL